MPAKHARQPPEPVPLFTKLVRVKVKDGIVIARSRGGGFEREGHMLPSLFIRLAMLGITALHKHGLMPKLTMLVELERLDSETVVCALSFKDAPDIVIRGPVSVEVAEQARDRLNELLPVNVRHIRVASGRL